MDLHLRDKVVIVTGGGAGIGGAISLQLAREGAVPVIFGRSALASDFADTLRALCPRFGFFQIELADEPACNDAVARTVAEFGGIVLPDRSSHTAGQWLHPDGGYVHLDRALP